MKAYGERMSCYSPEITSNDILRFILLKKALENNCEI